MACVLGTVGCPVCHNGVTPHCVACTEGTSCRFNHDPPVLEMSVEEFKKKNPELGAHL